MVDVPEHPTDEMITGLARDIVMWRDMEDRTGAGLYRHLKRKGQTAPEWLHTVIPDRDHVPPKGAVAAAIYMAMIEVAKG